MTHHELSLLVSSYCDDEIRDDNRSIVESHLSACQECRQFVTHANEIRLGIKQIDKAALPQTFALRVLDSLERQEIQKEEWIGIEPLARHTFYTIAISVVIMFILSSMLSPEIEVDEQSWSGVAVDSTASHIILQQDEITKNDLLYTVMSE